MGPRDANARGATIRAARPEDRERIVGAFRALHPQSVYQRFFFPKNALSDRELRWLTEPDGDRRVVLVATTRHDGAEAVVALGQYIRSGASAEIAFVVAEDHRGRGIASRMLQQLTDIARERGITQFEADVLADNTAMLTVFRRSKLPIKQSEEDGVVHLTLSLGDHGLAWRALWHRFRSRLPLRRFS
ncbi:MAG: N-acetyltransferase family protein [Rhodoplanes sp.]